MTAAVVTFALCAGIIIGGYWVLVVRPETRAAQSLRKRLTTTRERPRKTEITKTAAPLSAVRIIDSLLARSGVLIRPLQLLITLSGLSVTVGTILLASTLMAVLTFLVVEALVSAAPLAAVLAIIAAPSPVARAPDRAATTAAGRGAISGGDRSHRGVLRAGHALATALLIVAEEMAQPLSKEFRQIYDEQSYGKPLPDVLKGFTERVPLLDVRIFMTAVMTQREEATSRKCSTNSRASFESVSRSNVKSGLSAHTVALPAGCSLPYRRQSRCSCIPLHLTT